MSDLRTMHLQDIEAGSLRLMASDALRSTAEPALQDYEIDSATLHDIMTLALTESTMSGSLNGEALGAYAACMLVQKREVVLRPGVQVGGSEAGSALAREGFSHQQGAAIYLAVQVAKTDPDSDTRALDNFAKRKSTLFEIRNCLSRLESGTNPSIEFAVESLKPHLHDLGQDTPGGPIGTTRSLKRFLDNTDLGTAVRVGVGVIGLMGFAAWISEVRSRRVLAEALERVAGELEAVNRALQ